MVKFIAERADGYGRKCSMLRPGTVYNVNPNCISRDLCVGNLYIRLNENKEKRF